MIGLVKGSFFFQKCKVQQHGFEGSNSLQDRYNHCRDYLQGTSKKLRFLNDVHNKVQLKGTRFIDFEKVMMVTNLVGVEVERNWPSYNIKTIDSG